MNTYLQSYLHEESTFREFAAWDIPKSICFIYGVHWTVSGDEQAGDTTPLDTCTYFYFCVLLFLLPQQPQSFQSVDGGLHINSGFSHSCFLKLCITVYAVSMLVILCFGLFLLMHPLNDPLMESRTRKISFLDSLDLAFSKAVNVVVQHVK